MTGQDEASGWPPEGLAMFKHIEKNTTITSWLSVEEKRGWLRATSIVRPLDIILLISHDHTPDVLRARWAFIRSESTRGKYCTWLGKYSFRVLMLDSSSIYVWGNYYICLAAQITLECSNFKKTCYALVKYNWLNKSNTSYFHCILWWKEWIADSTHFVTD